MRLLSANLGSGFAMCSARLLSANFGSERLRHDTRPSLRSNLAVRSNITTDIPHYVPHQWREPRATKLVIQDNPDGKYLIKGGGPKIWKRLWPQERTSPLAARRFFRFGASLPPAVAGVRPTLMNERDFPLS